MKNAVIIDRFQGGISPSKKEGPPGSYAFGRSIEIREESSALTILPKTTKESGTLIKNLVIDSCRVPSGVTYFLDKVGRLYERSTAGVYSIAGQVFYAPQRDNLQAHWRFDNTTAGQTQNDNTNNANHLTDTNTVGITTTDTSVIGAAGADFERGSSHRLTRTNANLVGLNMTGAFTIVATVRPESVGNEMTICGIWETSGNQRKYRLWINTSGNPCLSVSVNGTDVVTVTGGHIFNAGEVETISARYIPGEILQIIVGDEIDVTNTTSIPASLHASTDDFIVGADSNSSAVNHYDGFLDELHIWDVALSPYELEIMVEGMGGDVEAGGMHYWAAKDTIYITAQQNTPDTGYVSTYGPIGNSPKMRHAQYAEIIDQQIDVTGNAAYPQSANIQGHWTMDESSGNAVDSSGNANTLTDTNTVAASTDKQEGTGSRDFEAANSEFFTITDGAQTGLDITSDMTIALWVKVESAPALNSSYHFVDKFWGAGNQRAYAFTYRNAGGTFQLQLDQSSNGTASNTEAVNQTLTVGTWYHLAVVYTAAGGTVDFYVNAVATGGQQSGAPTSIHNSTESFKLGTAAAGGNYMDGLMDDVLIWNVALTAAQVEDAMDAASGTYALATTISENEADRFEFVPTIDPHVRAVVPITTVGTGNWTVTVHDDANNTIATSTMDAADLVAGVDNVFGFNNQWRPIRGATYHYHITSSVADGEVTTGTDAIDTIASRLVETHSELHPITEFLDFLAIGNERYLTTYDGLLTEGTDADGTLTSSWDLHQLVLASGYEIISKAEFDEFLVLGATYGSGSPDNFTDGFIVFWDGTSEAFNFFISVKEGGVQTLLPIKNRLYFIAGIRGELFATNGEDYVKIKRLPKTTDDTYIETIFSSSTIYRGIPLFGLAYQTDNTTFEQGVYGFGAKESQYPDALTYDYPISTGTRTGTTNTLRIGVVAAYGSDLFIAWQDGAFTWGIDSVTELSAPFATATYESLIYDGGYPYIKKFIGTIRVDHQPILTGESILISRKIDQTASYTDDPAGANTTVGSTTTRFHVNAEFKDLQTKVTLGAGSTSPQANAITLDIEDDQAQREAV